MKSFLPIEWFIHQSEYLGYAGMDDFGNDSYNDPFPIQYSRFDNSTVYTRDTQQNEVRANGVLYVCAIRNSLPELTERSLIRLNDKEYTIAKVIALPFPTSDTIHHYELEVL